jgi:hypothetical protein
MLVLAVAASLLSIYYTRKPPKLPYTGGVAYQVFVDGSRDDHSTYHGGRR